MSVISKVSFTLNAKQYRDVRVSNPSELLLDHLQQSGIDLCGTKYGCGEGGCGACSVLVRPEGSTEEYRVINSCLRPLAACHGLDILTVEGLPKNKTVALPTSSVKANSCGITEGTVNEVAYSIAQYGGTQCGFCTPGFTTTLYEAKQHCDHANECKEEVLQDIEDLFSGNICRCTGYRGLKLAAKKVLLEQEPRIPPNVVDVEDKSYSKDTLHDPNGNVEVVSIETDLPQKKQEDPDHPSGDTSAESSGPEVVANDSEEHHCHHRPAPKPFVLSALQTPLPFRQWLSVKDLQEVQQIIDWATGHHINYKLVYGNTSAGIYKAEEWSDVQVFVDMNTLPLTLRSHTPHIEGGVLKIPTACTINALKRMVRKHQNEFVECKAILSLVERVAGNQVRNAGTVGGSVAMAVRRLFLSDTFLALVGCKTTAEVLFRDGRGAWQKSDSMPLLSLVASDAATLQLSDFKNGHFIIESLTVPLHAHDTILDRLFLRNFKVSRRLQNSHSLVNLACRVEASLSGTIVSLVVGNIARHFLRLTATEAAIVAAVSKLSAADKSPKSFLLLVIDMLLSTCRSELAAKIEPTDEYDGDEERINIAVNLVHRFLLAHFSFFCTEELTDTLSIDSNTYKERVKPRNDEGHGVQGYRVNKKTFPVSEPMIKTSAVQQAEGETKYTRTLPLPIGGVHATFLLSVFPTGELMWNEERVKTWSADMARLLARELSLVIKPEDIHLFRASDIGPGNILDKNSFNEYLLADLEVTYFGQAIAIVATPNKDASEFIAKDMATFFQARENSSDAGNPMCIVQFRDTYEPFVTLDNPMASVPVLTRDSNGQPVRSMVSRKFSPGHAINWISNLPDHSQKIDFSKYDNDNYVVISGVHEVGSQYHFPMETQNALAYAPSDACTEHNHPVHLSAELQAVAKHPCSRGVSVASLNQFKGWNTSAATTAAATTAAATTAAATTAAIVPRTKPRMNMHLVASTQTLTDISQTVSTVLTGLHSEFKADEYYQVHTHVDNVGGGFGGKEPQSRYCAVAAAVVADKLNRPCRVALDRNTDMRMIGKRHPYRGEYKVAADKKTGRIKAIYIHYLSDAGINYDCSQPVMDLSILSAFNGYNVDEFVCEGECYFTNKATGTAFRSFGVIQANQITEHAVEAVINALRKDAECRLNSFQIRKANFFDWQPAETDDKDLEQTPFGQPIRSCNLHGVWTSMSRRMLERDPAFRSASGDIDDEGIVRAIKLKNDAGFEFMQKEIDQFNREHQFVKQGLSVLPLMYGISFAYIPMNVMKATMEICPEDNMVYIQSFGVEVGQGLHTKLLQIAAYFLGVKTHLIRVNSLPPGVIETKEVNGKKEVVNYPGTGASTGTDLNGRAIAMLMDESGDFMKLLKTNEELYLWFTGDEGGRKTAKCWYDNHGRDRWSEFVAYCVARKKLTFVGEYSMVGLLQQISDSIKMGAPFYYFNYAAAMSKVQLDCLTGEWSIMATDIVYDAGVSINPSIDLGQIEGGFVQGTGYVTTEEITYLTGAEGNNAMKGQLTTDGTWTYKPPSTTETPEDFNVYLYPTDKYDIELLPEHVHTALDSDFQRCKACEESDTLSSHGDEKLSFQRAAKRVKRLKAVADVLQAGREHFHAHRIRERHCSIHHESDLIDTFGITSSKTTGEPPLVLGNTVFYALKDAVSAYHRDYHKSNDEVVLQCPATTYSLINALTTPTHK